MTMASLDGRNAIRGGEAGWMSSGGRVGPAHASPYVGRDCLQPGVIFIEASRRHRHLLACGDGRQAWRRSPVMTRPVVLHGRVKERSVINQLLANACAGVAGRWSSAGIRVSARQRCWTTPPGVQVRLRRLAGWGCE